MHGMYSKTSSLIFFLLLSVSSSIFAHEGGIHFSSKNEGIKVEIGGMTSMENGQFVNSFYQNRIQPNRPWILRTRGRLDFNAEVGDHLTIKASPEIMLWYDTYTWQSMGNEAFKYPFNQHSDVYFAEAQGIFGYTVPNAVKLEFASGIFLYKYNSEVKNLGEYLFRTGTRPAYICTAFDFAYARLTGLRLGAAFLNDQLTTDLMLTSETMVLPTRDWSVSWLCKYSMAPFSIGGGIMFDRLLPVDPSLESPETSINWYYTENNEKKFMSFGGTKIVGQLSFDPKVLLPESFSKRFGADDAKIYAEIAVLGTKSFTTYKHYMDPNTGITDTTRVELDSSKNYYADIGQRIPIMFGFNIPTFNVLNYLSAEFEWYPWPYPNSTGYIVEFRTLNPQPTPDKVNPDRIYTLDNWKYSINFKKTFSTGFSVIGQFSRDHSRHDYFYKGYLDLSEALVETDNIGGFGDLSNTRKWGSFGWWLKLQYVF
ncbi:MAG: hypothetical protein JXA18_13005 [Chitinispirillaceae bacterium]|nr:hypothetical protein [Chitinispirillaceae bacterium]